MRLILAVAIAFVAVNRDAFLRPSAAALLLEEPHRRPHAVPVIGMSMGGNANPIDPAHTVVAGSELRGHRGPRRLRPYLYPF